MTREELRDYVDEQRTLDNIPYHVYSALIDGIDTLEQEPCDTCEYEEGSIYCKEHCPHEAKIAQEPCGDAIDRSKAIMIASGYCHPANVAKELAKLPSVNPQPCKDAISRQAVIDSLHSKFADGFDSDRWWNSMSVLYVINKVPPVNPTKTGWIPVSERLPEDKTYVLTTIKVPNRIAHARSGWYQGGFFHNDNGDTWKATDMEVVAWMPLPEPYKAESEEQA